MPSVLHARPTTSTTWPPACGLVQRCRNGRNRLPSLRKKKVSTSVTTPVTSALATAPSPTSTPEAMLAALDWSRRCAEVTAASICASVTPTPRLRICDSRRVSPSEALSASSTTSSLARGASNATAPPNRATNTTMTSPEAAARGSRSHRSASRAGGCRTLASTSASTTGSRMLHSRPTSSPSR